MKRFGLVRLRPLAGRTTYTRYLASSFVHALLKSAMIIQGVGAGQASL